ncbi:MAG: sugar phosphate isomerase/epimerase [Candidatus Latescibacteria bacterium]|nr:sugar phosphate isomerase/epimerase [Candidatus Latescibacterota bacterium]
MKLGIDSYCYHRYFGEIYPGIQRRPAGRRMTVDDFLSRAKRYGVDGVSLESCFFPSFAPDALRRIKERLDEHGFERVWAWGHPDGLTSGTDRKAEQDLVAHIGHARAIGAGTMRIVGGSRRTRPDSWSKHFRQLRGALKRVVPRAEEAGVTLAIENHIDLMGDEMVELIESIHSPNLGVTLDTGNNLRLFEDPVEVCRKLAPYTRATHVKDIGAWRGDPKTFSFWPSVPLGDGIVDLKAVVGFLKKAKYRGLLCVEVDFLHPDHGEEDEAVQKSLAYLRGIVGKR